MSKQFYFKQFNLAYKNSLFQTMQLSISTQFKSQNSSIFEKSI